MTAPTSPWSPPPIPPERLFRRLLWCPRPWAPVDYRYPTRPDLALHVRALTPYEIACAMDVDIPGGLPASVTSDAAMAGLATAALWEPSGPVFSSPQEASKMPQREWTRLMSATLTALYGIMPSRVFCQGHDWAAWGKVLEKGATHPSNFTEALRIRSCHDVAVGWAGRSFHRRPDRYFGLPVSEITEGQQLAFDIAFDSIENLRQTHK